MTARVRLDYVCAVTGLGQREVVDLAARRLIPRAAQYGPRTWTFDKQALLDWLPYFRESGLADGAGETRRPGPFGLIYAIQGLDLSPVKIGFSTPDAIDARLLSLQTGNPYPLRILARTEGHMRDEKNAHRALSADRMAGEWFAWSEQVRAFVEAMPAGIKTALQTARKAA